MSERGDRAMTTPRSGPSDDAVLHVRLGRLEVSRRNPRYFAVAEPHEDAGRVV